jgi:two-component system, cell cycle sensor histidine kinase and response regulator CckA
MNEREKQFRTIADAFPVMLWTTGPDKRCTFFNKRWLGFTGHTLESELALGWIGSVHPSDVPRCTANYASGFDLREEFHFECRLRRADGEYRWMLASGVPQFSAGSVFSGYIGCCTDVSEVRLVRRQTLIHKRLETIGHVAAGIAHDFNNLLATIVAYAEVALADRPPRDTSVTVERIHAVAIRASEIVRELMVYAGRDEGEMTAVDLSVLVEEMLDLLKVSISKQARITTDLASGPPAVFAEVAELWELVMNLILNASDALQTTGGAIHIATSPVVVSAAQSNSELPAGSYMRLEVSDTGNGMSADVQARVFEPFFTTKSSGKGIGLSVARRIVRRYGGSIQCQSAPGEGACFVVLLPCGSAGLSCHAAAEPQSLSQPLAPGTTVLVVEDEEGLRIPVSALLRQQGVRVIEAGDGTTALEMLQNDANEIDAILLDLTLPGTPSHEVIAAASRIRPDIKILLTSAYSSRDAAPALAATQVKGFIRKPYQFGELSRALSELLADGPQPERLPHMRTGDKTAGATRG